MSTPSWTIRSAQVKGGIPNSAVSPRKNRISNVEGIVNGDGETIHHIITTDDGQKVSVDINLRILSPRTSDQYNSPHNHPNIEGIYPTEQSTKMSPVHHPSGPSKPATGGYNQKVRGADVKQNKVLKDSRAPKEVPPGPQYLAGIQVQAPNAYTDGGYVPGGYSYHGHSGPHAKSTIPVTESRSQYIYYTPNANSAPTERQNYLSPSFQIPNQIQHSATSMQHNSFHDQSTQPVQKFNEQPKTFQFHPGLPVSPYKVLPPVSNATELTGLRSPKFHAGGSYLDQYQRTKNRQAGGDYHEYTLVDYKKLQKEIKYTPLGTLGPDLESEELREKREKTMRQLEYARNIKKRHLANIRAAREKELEALEQREASPITTEGITKTEETKDEKLSNFNSASGKRELKVGENNCQDINGEKHSENISEKRRLALDYAKRVRKPKVRQRSSAPTEGLPSSQRGSFPLGGLNKEDNGKKTVGAWTPQETTVGDVSVDAEELLRLQQRHEHERNDVAALLLHT